VNIWLSFSCIINVEFASICASFFYFENLVCIKAIQVVNAHVIQKPIQTIIKSNMCHNEISTLFSKILNFHLNFFLNSFHWHFSNKFQCGLYLDDPFFSPLKEE
jgi:hypothetical protein